MKRIVCCLVLVALVMLGATYFAQAATEEEAKAIVEKALAYYKANGKDKAFAEFNNPNGSFVKGDVYLVVLDFKGNVLVHGGNPKLTGVNLWAQKDPNSGKLFVQEMIEVSKTKGSGWILHNWVNPVTKKVQAKKTWIKKIDDMDALINCGIFQ